jgi:arylsulfatase A-like enzyme
MDSLPVDFPTRDVGKINAHAANRSDGQYLRNVRYRRREEDYFCAQLYAAACEWLEMNRGHEQFFLWIDGFDPHEPWDPPQHYVDLYEDGYDGDVFLQHIAVPPEGMTEGEINHLKATYAGSVTLVDRWWGELFKTLERLHMLDDTAVIVMADHGTYLAEHGKVMGKTAPLYDQVAQVPLIIRLPDGTGAGKRFDALAQAPDIMPTVLGLAGLPIPDTVQGRSLLPVLRGEAEDVRELAFSGSAPDANADEAVITVRDGRWTLHDSTDRARWELYDGESDPAQERNVVKEHPAEADRLHAGLLDFLRAHDAQRQIVRWFETGDRGDMTGYRYRPPGYENFGYYWSWILDSKIVPE